MAKVKWIGVRPERKAPLEVVQKAEVNSFGLVGDHYSKEYGTRNITLIKNEHISELWEEMQLMGKPDPGRMRRNIVVEGLEEGHYKDAKIRIGEDVLLLVTGECRPCSRMDENLGNGGLSKMSGKGGLTLKVEKGGWIKVGDEVNVSELKPPSVEKYLP